jgi:hypothetical protein
MSYLYDFMFQKVVESPGEYWWVRTKHCLNRIDAVICLFMGLMCNACILLYFQGSDISFV